MSASSHTSTSYSSPSTSYPSFPTGSNSARHPDTSHTSTQGPASYPSFPTGSNSTRRPDTIRTSTQGPASYPSFPTGSNSARRPDTSRTSTRGPDTSRTSHGRPRPKTAASIAGGSREHQFICALSESRGISPIVGLAFVDITTAQAVMCQISDNLTFAKTIHKLSVFYPTEILFMTTATQPKPNLYSFVEGSLPHSRLVVINRKYWSETTGMEYIEQLAFRQDVEAIKVSIGRNFYATCCLSAVLKYIEQQLMCSISPHSLRIRYEPSEDSMMIDLSTIHSLELIQNLQHARSKDCLFGILNQTLTPMGRRLLKSNVLQPLTRIEELEIRYDAVGELTRKEEVFFAVRQALKAFVDVDRVLTAITVVPTNPTIHYWEQSINNVIMLKQYVNSVPPIHEALGAAESTLLRKICEICAPANIESVQSLIDDNINPDISYQTQPLDLRNQRTYAVKSGVHGLLDIARLTYKEINEDAYQSVMDLGQAHNLALDLKYDTLRQYYIQIPTSELEERDLPEIFINPFRKKRVLECQTLDLKKMNQRIIDSHNEVLQLSREHVQALITGIVKEIRQLFKVSDAIAWLDMIAAFAQLATTQDYCRPEMTETLAVKNGRHPIQEIIRAEKYIPNDAYATQQSRFQIITGCNMSGKSTYIRSLALMAIMAQTGSFVPASYASFPIFHKLFARISMDDSIEANMSTFAAEMRETAFILRNVDKRSMVIIDELGRGTSTRDGISIAIAIAEALVESRALVWFVTHFRDLATILGERNGVVILHLAAEMGEADKMKMLYKVASGCVQEKHYGLALARVMDLPPHVLQVAEEVSKALVSNIERRKRGSKAVAIARRRKLVLNLKEQLTQARDGNMQGKVLWTWMKKLQDEFVVRMAAINAEIETAEGGNEGESENQQEDELAKTASDGGDIESRDTRSTEAESRSAGSRGGGFRYEMSGALPVEMDVDE